MPPLPESLTVLMRAHEEQGGRGELTVEGLPRELAPEVALTLLRTVQEALTNARRHAPGSAVSVKLLYEPRSTSVVVLNNTAEEITPSGAPTPSGGYGLTGMRERLELAGGLLQAGPEHEGWAVRAQVPA
jgi:signal transduction histidine kinase